MDAGDAVRPVDWPITKGEDRGCAFEGLSVWTMVLPRGETFGDAPTAGSTAECWK
jgi:hypothetical protein